jgi:cytochrome c oxidase subunit IV
MINIVFIIRTIIFFCLFLMSIGFLQTENESVPYYAGILFMAGLVFEFASLALVVWGRVRLLPLKTLWNCLDWEGITGSLRWLVGLLCLMGTAVLLSEVGWTVGVVFIYLVALILVSPLEKIAFDKIRNDPDRKHIFSRDSRVIIITGRSTALTTATLIAIVHYEKKTFAEWDTGVLIELFIVTPFMFLSPISQWIARKRKRKMDARQQRPGTKEVIKPDAGENIPVPEVQKNEVMEQAQSVEAEIETSIQATAPHVVARYPPVPTMDKIDDTRTILEDLKQDFIALSILEPQRRGYAFQDFLNKLFNKHHLSSQKAFRVNGEEIDGSFEIASQVYLLEAKWQAAPCGQADLLVFNGKVEGKSTWARGIFISYAGFTTQGLDAFSRGKRTSIIGMDGQDILHILNGEIALVDAIRAKARKAVEKNSFFVPVREIIEK